MSNNPNLLHHYTTQAGLLGILKARRVWATSISFLNDSQEFLCGFELLKDLIRDESPKSSPAGQKFLASAIPNPYFPKVPPHVFVFSMSAQADELSLWRAYAPQGAGYQITFNVHELQQLDGRRGSRLVHCLYEVPDQRALLLEVVQKWLQQVDNYAGVGWFAQGGEDTFRLQFWLDVLRACARIKNRSFQHEHEWRLVLDHLQQPDNLQFRQGQSAIVPYLDFDLTDQAERLPITSITVGPCADTARAAEGVRTLLASFGLGLVPVEVTNSPFQNW